ncbi:alpha-hydroxy acid oxidase [Catenuloplanes atrovinosus]|uniref:4-hydroxymandelate oxidase n=1 Tax=Catenuloplanes atrovinosus TaxID=137266 RepID=A0AAE4CAJ1_9ACTN|nr:alpha-hydroxy acid oxidase [Catenuloplanes atrovinosus]MDR7277108.1 4-hydroxymandelate oxidase [Catenuloplanes atrovinosus]
MTLVSLRDVAVSARRRLVPAHYDFFAGGAGEERTLRDNRAAFDRWRLRPRVLRAAGVPDPRVELFGTELSGPVLIAPTAFHRLAHPDGEVATARAARAAGTVMTVSMAATRPLEQIAATGARLWFQLYPQPDRDFTASLVKRAERACTALVVSVDSPVLGRRARDLRNGFLDLPPGLACENLRDPVTGKVRDIVMDPSLGWDDIDRLRAGTGLPVLLKGVLHPADAREAVARGVDGIIVSNHGGRQLDNAVAAIDALPAVVGAVDGRIPVLLDGGVRRGTDVLTALALGASAVLVGRPVIWGLAHDGEAGVRQVLSLLHEELTGAMALCGAATVADLTRDLLAA